MEQEATAATVLCTAALYCIHNDTVPYVKAASAVSIEDALGIPNYADVIPRSFQNGSIINGLRFEFGRTDGRKCCNVWNVSLSLPVLTIQKAVTDLNTARQRGSLSFNPRVSKNEYKRCSEVLQLLYYVAPFSCKVDGLGRRREERRSSTTQTLTQKDETGEIWNIGELSAT